MDLASFADWLSRTSISLAIQTRAWAVPAIQSIHITAIGIVLASVLMMSLRVLGYAGRDETLRDTANRFGPWLTRALVILLITGVLMVIGEPARELLAVSFWLKMGLLAVGVAGAAIFRMRLVPASDHWGTGRVPHGSVRWMAVMTLVLWACIVVLGRLIAYDHVWGAWFGVAGG